MCFLGKTLLVFSLLHFYSKTKLACYSRCFLTSYFCIPVPYNEKVRGDRREELPHAAMPEARGGGQEEQPHLQGAVAVRVPEGLEELFHIQGQEGWR